MKSQSKIRLLVLSSAFIFLLNFAVFAEVLTVRHIKPESKKDQRSAYFIALLNLALDKTEAEKGPYKSQKIKVIVKQSRALRLLSANKIVDVVWTMTSKKREKDLRPVRIPLLKGLLGHRIFIINKGDQARFAKVSDESDLKKLRAGQGHDWPDIEILKSNGITVFSSPSYEGLFRMLAKKRFDYFPRGLNEPFNEVEARPELNLMVEESLLIQYPAPIFFFTHKKNNRLAQRLEQGLRLAIEDGSFDGIFYNHPSNKKMFDQAKITERKIFRFDNPLLTEESAALLKEKELWYKP